MRQPTTLSSDVLLAGLRAAGEETRLRILALLSEGELSVSDLTDILGQSQPRISRHLKLLAEAGLVRRSREGAWAFFRLDETGPGGAFAASLAAWLDLSDPVLAADRERLAAVRTTRAEAAQNYFASVARDWDRLRGLVRRGGPVLRSFPRSHPCRWRLGPAPGHALAWARPARPGRSAGPQNQSRGCVMNAFRPSRHGSRRPRVSFEFFPPKTEEMEVALWDSVRRLEPLGPSFVSVTYGAGGSTRERTHATVKRMVDETGLKPAAHLTCVSASKAEVDEVIRSYWDAGVRHVVALRGDHAGGLGTPYEPHADGYHQTSDLVAGLKRIGDFEVTVSAYPEKHPEAASLDADIDALQKKVDAGATRAITQFFFDNDVYFRYLDKVRARGIEIPILPGIVPVQNFKQTANFARKTGASVPQWLADRFEGLEDDVATRRLVAAAVCAEQVLDLIDRGATDLHFYTMNKADLVYAICHLVGLKPEKPAAQAVAAE